MQKKVTKSEKLEFTLVILTSLLLLVSLIPKDFPPFMLHITSLFLLGFIGIKIYHMVKKGSSLFEDYASLVILVIFWAIHLTIGSKLNPISIGVFVTFLILYGVTSILWAKDLFEIRNVMLFLVSYAVFVTLIIFLFAGAYFAHNDLFVDKTNQPLTIVYTEALYFSTITFTTVGYGDISPLKSNRLIASIEAITAVTLNIAFMGYILASRRFKSPKEHLSLNK